MKTRFVLSAIFCIAAAYFLAVQIRDSRPHHPMMFAPGIPEAQPALFHAPKPTPVFPKRKPRGRPVIAGGVLTAEDLLRKIQRDPSIAKHYRDSGYDVSTLHVHVLNAPLLAWLSYRLDGTDTFLWTQRAQVIQAGERVLVDEYGSVLIRGRCGNLISMIPRSPVAPAEEEIAAPWNTERTPLVSYVATSSYPKTSAPLPWGYTSYPPVFGGPCCGGGGSTGTTTSAAPLPPPGILWGGSILLLVAAFRKLLRRFS